MNDARQMVPKRSFLRLIADLPGLLIDQIRNEFELLKQEIVGKLKYAGIGVGLLIAGGCCAFFAMGVLIAAAILGLAEVLPGWAAALIVAGALLIITVILVGIGLQQLKRGTPPAPTETITSVKKDINAIKGIK